MAHSAQKSSYKLELAPNCHAAEREKHVAHHNQGSYNQ